MTKDALYGSSSKFSSFVVVFVIASVNTKSDVQSIFLSVGWKTAEQEPMARVSPPWVDTFEHKGISGLSVSNKTTAFVISPRLPSSPGDRV